MDSESASVNSSPVLRITTDISELKDNNEYVKQTCYKPHSRESRINVPGNPYIRKKTLHPINGGNSHNSRSSYGGSYVNMQNAKSNVSSFTQRVMSAKLLRVKQLQNQLGESQTRITELINENRLLKTLQRRQDSALKKYEGNQEQLPQLIKSHNEEIRILNAKFKQLKLNYRMLENKLKDRDTELINLKEQHKHLLKLSRDKQLGDREKLSKKLEDMESYVKTQQDKIQMLTRKVELEGKNYRHRLNLEVSRHKETQKELQEARTILDSIKSIEGKKKYVNVPIVSKKILQPCSTATSQTSQISLPAAPPNVSIRQPQMLVFSETTIHRGDDSEDSDSFSFGLQNMPLHIADDDDDDSDRSNSDLDEEKPVDVVSNNTKITKIHVEAKNIQKKTNYATSVLSNEDKFNNINVESKLKILNTSTKRPILKLNSTVLENKITRFNLKECLKSEQKNTNVNKIIEKKALPTSTAIRNSSRRNSVANIGQDKRNSITLTAKESSTTNLPLSNAIRRHSLTTKLIEKPEKESKKLNNIEDDILLKHSNECLFTNKFDNELTNMQKEIEKELDLMLINKPEEENIDQLAKGNLNSSMEAAIEELERKFKVFDMPQIRKEAEDGINKIVDRACMSLYEDASKVDDSQSNNNEELEQGFVSDKVNNELEEDNFLKKLENCYKEVDSPQPDIILGETQKAHLLKALSNIDHEIITSSNQISSNIFQDDKNKSKSFNNSNSLKRYTKVTGNLMNGKSHNGSVVMKELFNEETVSSK